jgi:hypothetical protein
MFGGPQHRRQIPFSARFAPERESSPAREGGSLTEQLAAIVRERGGFAQARKRALARLREGIDLRWTPALSRHDVHER